MKKAIIILVFGTLISFLLNFYLVGRGEAVLDLYYGFAFGLGWSIAYYVDRPDFELVKKMGLSLIGMAALVILGFVFFDFEIAVPSIIRFSTVFVAYYLIASFRESKSLRY